MPNAPLPSNEEMMRNFQQTEVRAHDIVDNALTVERSPSELLHALGRVTRLEDKQIDAIQKIVDERAARGEIQGIACAKGCWFCCTQMVAVTIPEVLRLAEHIRNEWSPEQRAELDQRMASYMAATEPYRSGLTKTKPRHICPFLKDAACSVWLVRPIVCRAFNSTDVDACIYRKDHPGEEQEPLVPSITGQLYMGMYCRTGMRQALKKHGIEHDMHEMIPALIIALKNPDAGERWMAGDSLFDDTKVKGLDV